jgi:hypothetical protein
MRHFHKPYFLELTLGLYYGGLATAAGLKAEHDWVMLGYCAGMALVFVVLSFGDMYM